MAWNLRWRIRLIGIVDRIAIMMVGALAIGFALLSPALALAQHTHSAHGATTSKIAWLAFDGGGARSGANYAEGAITPSTVSHLTQFWHVTLPAVVDGSPVEQPNVVINGVSHDMLFVTTTTGSLLAIDAQSGNILWRADHPAGSCMINNGSTPCYTTSSPAIDPNGQYVYTYGLDGYAHKHVITTGAEITTGGWPELITLKPYDEKGSSSLNIGDGYLYVTTAGYPGDHGNYQGHVVTINLATGAQTVFNAICTNQPVHFVEHGSPDCDTTRAAIWARAGAVIDPVLNGILMATGNGDFDGVGHDYGDSVIRLNLNGTGANGYPLDSYTPSDFQQLEDGDLDLGSSAPALLVQQQGSRTPFMAFQIGKDGVARLINRQNLSGRGGPAHYGGEVYHLDLSQYGEVLTQPVAWLNRDHTQWIFVANDSGLTALTVSTNKYGYSSLNVVYHNSDSGSSPFFAGGLLYVQGNGILRALIPTTGQQMWSAPVGSLHWQSPIVVNGMVFTTDNDGGMYAFHLG